MCFELLQIQYMANNSTDKQIQELLLIKLGLQKKSQKLFQQLLNENVNDPLDELFKGMMRKNREIQNLKRELERSKAKIEQLHKHYNPDYKQPQKVEQMKVKSLPEGHEQTKKKIEDSKKEVNKERQAYVKKTQSFIIFLLKCIRSISKSRGQSQQKIQQVEKKIKLEIKKQQQKLFQEQKLDNKFDNKSVNSQVSTKAEIDSQKRLNQLILKIKNRSKNQPQKIFGQIHKSLGLQEQWSSYLENMKQKAQIFDYYQQSIKQSIKQQSISQRSISQQSVNQQNTNQQSTNQQSTAASQRSKFQNWSQQIKGLFDFNKIVQINKFQNDKIKKQIQTKIFQKYKSSSSQIEDMVSKVYDLIQNILSYLFDKLDQTFIKHNQHPFKIQRFKRIQKEIFSQFVKNKQWGVVRKKVQDAIDQNFNFIERNIKFYSANKAVMLTS